MNTNKESRNADHSQLSTDQALDYIADMLSELSEIADAAMKPDLAELIRFTHRATVMQAP